MGCDIHTMAEVLVTPTKWDREKGEHVPQPPKWRGVKKEIFPNPYFWEWKEVYPFGKYSSNIPFAREPYKGRNYELFSVLANVRNDNPEYNIFDRMMRYEMRDSLLPIALPRGVPDDASKEWRKYVSAWGADLHSTSYFTLTELLQAVEDGAFTQTFENGGYVSVDAYRALKKDGTKPTNWAGWASDGISEAQYQAMSAEDQLAFKGWVATRWPDTTGASMSAFVEGTIPELLKLAPFIGKSDREAFHQGQPDTRPRDTDKVRLVFGFDN